MNVQSVISNLRCAKNPLAAPGRSSETILRAELDLPRRGTDIRDLSKVAVGYSVVRIAIARDVEDVEEIRTKTDRLGLGNMEVFECREIHLPVTRCALTPNGRGAKGKRCSGAISAGAIVAAG